MALYRLYMNLDLGLANKKGVQMNKLYRTAYPSKRLFHPASISVSIDPSSAGGQITISDVRGCACSSMSLIYRANQLLQTNGQVVFCNGAIHFVSRFTDKDRVVAVVVLVIMQLIDWWMLV